jgi:hypothetical protein
MKPIAPVCIRYLEEYIVQPILPTLHVMHGWEVSDALDAGMEDYSFSTSLSVEGFSKIYWPVDKSGANSDAPLRCFLWSIDKRLHYIFAKAFVGREVFLSTSKMPCPLYEESIAKSLAGLVQELSCKEGHANIYFVQKEMDGEFEMILNTHQEVGVQLSTMLTDVMCDRQL